MIDQIDQIAEKLSSIKRGGYVQSLRGGSTGIGYTLETLLGIKENNLHLPDIGNIELKAQRENHPGMTTLFTFNKTAWKMPQLEAVKKYGSKDSKGRMGMYYTMKMTPNNAGLFLSVEDEAVSIRHTDGNVVASWQLQDLEKRFTEKASNVLLVKAKVKVSDRIEHFLYDRARLLTGGTSVSILKSQFKSVQLLIDLRLHDKGTSVRNHGTGFRVYERNLEYLYNKIKEISF